MAMASSGLPGVSPRAGTKAIWAYNPWRTALSDDLDFPAAHLAAEIPDRQRKTVADLLAEGCRRTGQGHDHADL